jgi:UDP-glucose 4-epimerase
MVKVKMNILITGGCGFVAGRIAELLSVEHHVTVIDNMRYWKDKRVVPKGINHFNGDVDKFVSVMDYDLVIHGATVNIIHAMTDPRSCVDTNWNQTVNFFDMVPQEVPIIYLSTSSVYGNGVQIPTSEECRVAPSNVYAMTKLMAEEYLIKNHPNCVIARLSNVYGPRQRPENPYSGVMVKMLESSITGKKFTMIGDGRQTRDFTYVDDVGSAVMALFEKGKRAEVYNVGTGIETSIKDLSNNLPEGVDIVSIEPRPIDTVNRRCLSIDKIKMHTGWEPKVRLSDGIARSTVWLMGEGYFLQG